MSSTLNYIEAASGISNMRSVRAAMNTPTLSNIFLKPDMRDFEHHIVGEKSVIWETGAQLAHLPVQQMIPLRLAAVGQKVFCLFPSFHQAKAFAQKLGSIYQRTTDLHNYDVSKVLTLANNVDDRDNDIVELIIPSSNQAYVDDASSTQIYLCTYHAAMQTHVHNQADALVMFGSETRSVTTELYMMRQEVFTAPTKVYFGNVESEHSRKLLGLDTSPDLQHYTLTQEENDVPFRDAIRQEGSPYVIRNSTLSVKDARAGLIDEIYNLIQEGHRGILAMVSMDYNINAFAQMVQNRTDLSIEIIPIADTTKTNAVKSSSEGDVVRIFFGNTARCVRYLHPSFKWITAGVSDGFEKIDVIDSYTQTRSSKLVTLQDWCASFVGQNIALTAAQSKTTPKFILLQDPSPEQYDKVSTFEFNDMSLMMQHLLELSLNVRPNQTPRQIMDPQDLKHALCQNLVDHPDGNVTSLGTHINQNRHHASHLSHTFLDRVVNHDHRTEAAVAAALPIAALLSVRTLYVSRPKLPRWLNQNNPLFNSGITTELNVFLHYLKNTFTGEHAYLVPNAIYVSRAISALHYLMGAYEDTYMHDPISTQDILNLYFGDDAHETLKMGSDVSDVIRECLALTFADKFYSVVSGKKQNVAYDHISKDFHTITDLSPFEDSLVCGLPYQCRNGSSILTRATEFEVGELLSYLNTDVHSGLCAMKSEDGESVLIYHTASNTLIRDVAVSPEVPTTSSATRKSKAPPTGSMAEPLRRALQE